LRSSTEKYPGLPAGVTLWRRIADEIERAIVRGEFAKGERLPGEVDIAARFDVNRHTVRRALAELAERGLVRASRGSGTFVDGTRLPYPIRSRTRFSEIVSAAGREAGGRLVGHGNESATADIAQRLALAPGSEVTRLEIVRSADRVPICASTAWLPAAQFPDLVRRYRANRSMTETFAQFGISEYRRQRTRISACLADAVDAARLSLPVGSPLVVLDSIDVTPDGRPVLTARARFVADRVELTVES
jgi:GntR family phosphonate transport system transcriptional regulator